MGQRTLIPCLTRAMRKYWFNASVGGDEQPPNLLNNESLLAINAAGTGTVALIKADANNIPILGAAPKAASVGTAAGSLVTVDGVQTLTGKTFTSPVLNTPTLNAPIVGGIVKSTAQFDAVTGTTGATLTNIAGLVVTVVPGTYQFRINLPMVTTANAGVKAGFKFTTAVLTSIEYIARLYTASGVAVTHGTTNTDQALMAALTAAITINVQIEGTMVVGTGGTLQLQAAQNAAHVDTLSIYAGASMAFTRIA